MNDHANTAIEILRECERQDEKWGDQRNNTDGRWALILLEELGEAAEAFLENDPGHARVELIQSAAVLAQWAENVERRGEYDSRND